MRRYAAFVALAGSLFALSGCQGIECPAGFEPSGGRCICPPDTQEVDGACVPGAADAADAGSGVDGRGVARPRRDAGAVPAPEGGTPEDAGSGPPDARDGSLGAPDAARPPEDAGAVIAPTPAERCRASCPLLTHRCDNAGACVPVSRGCFDGVKGDDEACDDGNTDPYDECVSCEQAYCGDGFIQKGAPRFEQCERNAVGPGLMSGPQFVWNADNCDFATCQRKNYKLCTKDSDCTWAGGVPGGCLFGLCLPPRCREPGCQAECPSFPEYETFGLAVWSLCAIRCRDKDPICPADMRCDARVGDETPALCVNVKHELFDPP